MFRSNPHLLIITPIAALLATTAITSPLAARAASETQGGVELQGDGVLTTFGSNTMAVGNATHWTSDIARSVSLESSGTGGWVLDGYGGIHPFGDAPSISGMPYWRGWDIARALFIVPGTEEGYELDGYGGIHAFGGAPSLLNLPYPYWKGDDIARGLDIHLNASGVPDGGATLDEYGVIHPWGDYPYTLRSGAPTFAGRNAFLALHDIDGSLYAVGRYGTFVTETSGAELTPDWSGYTDWGDADVLRDIVITSPSGGSSPAPPQSVMAQRGWQGVIGPRGGVVLDGYGGLHLFGGMQLDYTNYPYWRGVDIARSLALLPDGSGGWTLDGYGGIHAFGHAVEPTEYPYWPGYDIARALVMNPDGRTGYVLDGRGVIHPVDGAPALSGYPVWPPGADVARGLVIDYTDAGVPDGGWTLDNWGAVHPFGAAASVPQPQEWPGRNLYQRLHATYDGDMYTVSLWGIVTALTPPPFTTQNAAPFNPYWSGYADWGSWNIVRDLVLFGSDSASPAPQPVSAGASAAYWQHVWVMNFGIAPVQQGLPLDCESAALEEATIARGRDVSQYTIFDDLPKQPGSATMSGGWVLNWGDPYQAFVGNVYGSESRGTGYGVYDPAIVQVADGLGFNAIGLEHGSPNQLYTYLAMGDPVVVITSDTFSPVATHWWSAWDGRSIPYSFSDHAVTLVAENAVAGTITLNDVADGLDKQFTMAQFTAFWTTYLDMAVVLT